VCRVASRDDVGVPVASTGGVDQTSLAGACGGRTAARAGVGRSVRSYQRAVGIGRVTRSVSADDVRSARIGTVATALSTDCRCDELDTEPFPAAVDLCPFF
jgi:hypothetical protein